MTIAHPGADYCAFCMTQGLFTPAMEEWPGAPLCRDHIIQYGGTLEDQVATVIDLSAARARLRSPPTVGEVRGNASRAGAFDATLNVPSNCN